VYRNRYAHIIYLGYVLAELMGKILWFLIAKIKKKC